MLLLLFVYKKLFFVFVFVSDEDSRDHLSAWPSSAGGGGGGHNQTCCLVRSVVLELKLFFLIRFFLFDHYNTLKETS
jgi:hypothetical protein